MSCCPKPAFCRCIEHGGICRNCGKKREVPTKCESDMNVTEFLASHGLRAEKAYNALAIKVYRGDELAFELAGSDLAKNASVEGTKELIKRMMAGTL